MSASAGPVGEARTLRLFALLVLVVAWLPSLGTLRTPWIAEDAGILAQVAEDGPWRDWTRSQYGLHTARFWRPLVSTSWSLQESWTGIEPAPLRLFNLALHALAALLAFATARRLGARPFGALVAGLWVATFPAQGGTCTWLAGRTDLLGAVFLLGSLYVGLGPRPLAAAPLAFLACAAKEFGFLAPLWLAFFAWTRGERGAALVRRLAPATLAVLGAFVWRALALGTVVGGYAGGVSVLAGLAGAARAVFTSIPSTLVALAALAAVGRYARCFRASGVLAGLLAAGAATACLAQLLADGVLEPEHRRLFYVPECAFALAAGLSWSRKEARLAPLWIALVTALLGFRGVRAWQDAHTWSRAGVAGEAAVTRARAVVAPAEPGTAPVFFADFPVIQDGAYCLGFGLAARFRPPFPASPRPVWPWRLVFVQASARSRSPLVAARADGSLWPLDDAPLVPVLGAETEDGAPLARLVLDERSFFAAEDRSPRLSVSGGSPGATLEGLWISELGYEPVLLGVLDESGALELSLMQLLLRGNGVVVSAEVLFQAADLGATRAYLELRAVAPSGEVRAASRWIELVWAAELRERAPSAR
jgi:hypothetical protein